jgi:hypothetical protein
MPRTAVNPAFNVACRARRGAGPRCDTHEISGEPPTAILLASRSASLRLTLDADALTLTATATPGILHYFRLADATLKPLSDQPGPLAFAPGDTYIALTPGVRRIADGPTVARFLHLRDDFNAEKLAGALLEHLVEMAGVDELPEDITALVIEAR